MLIFEPGFSTADEVSRLAGRGVGMDVVASEVRQLGGALDIHSKAGEGTNFVLRLPQTLAVTQAVFVRIGETSFAVPIAVLGQATSQASLPFFARLFGEKRMREFADTVNGSIYRVVATSLLATSFMMAAAFFSLLFALSWADVSLVAPASASLTFVANAVAAKIFLHERVDHRVRLRDRARQDRRRVRHAARRHQFHTR